MKALCFLFFYLIIGCSSPQKENHFETSLGQQKTASVKQESWQKTLKDKNIKRVTLCGNSKIRNTENSLKKDFIIHHKGYLFSDLPLNSSYWKILKSYNLEDASKMINEAFKKTVLWEISENGDIRSLGHPEKIDTKFTSTIKDCMEGKKTTLGTNCSKNKDTQLACCSEKFVGPNIFWRSNETTFKLMYSPDPSIRLKINQEHSHRFCLSESPLNL